MLAKVFSAFPSGLGAVITEVEVEVEPGLRAFHIIGLPDEAVRESIRRVSSAIRHAGFSSPLQMNKRITVNLAPAAVKKQGSVFDVAIAVGFLLASGQLSPLPEKVLFIGELNLKGELRPIAGALGIAMMAKKKGFLRIVVPVLNAHELHLVPNITLLAPANLNELTSSLRENAPANPPRTTVRFEPSISEYDLGDIRGQESAKRALEVAAAGSHHLFLIGPPGAGKSILAKALASLLPPLDKQEGIEVATILSSLEPLIKRGGEIVLRRPFRFPHHSASTQAILGGGAPITPGEITLAHRGILLLDEFPEFHRDVLEGLRQPLEDKVVRIARSRSRFTFPANFQLVGTANPCPCGFKDDPTEACVCTPGSINKYQRKLSGPLMDRVDMFVLVPRLSKEEMLAQGAGAEDSSLIRKRVWQARLIQQKRFHSFKTNAQMNINDIKVCCPLDSASRVIVGKAIDHYRLSMRGYHKLLKVARTIADLDGSQRIESNHVMEALQYRKQM